jgi:hypothetical protein
MKKTRTPPELVEAEWETVVAAEEALNASFLRTLLVRSNEGRVVACGREESVARVIKELVPNRRPADETEKRLVQAAEGLRQMSGSVAYVLAMGDGFVLTCGEANEVASILDADHEIDVPMATHQVFMRSQPQRLTL